MNLTRRRFLQAGTAGAGISAINLSAFPALANSFNQCTPGYRAVVGIDLAGGNDGYNMLIPTTENAHNQYRTLRGKLALPSEQCLPLVANDGTSSFALNSAMIALEPFWQSSELLPILNIGPLTQRVNKEIFDKATRPAHLFSHSHQSTMVQSHAALSLSKEGFGARTSNELGAILRNLNGLAPMFDVGGTQVWTNCITAPSNSVGTSLPKNIISDQRARQLFENLQQADQYENIFQSHYAGVATHSTTMYQEFSAILNSNVSDLFPNTGIGKQLKTIFKLILHREQFQHPAQYFSCKLGGFDTHSAQLSRQTGLLQQLAEAMAAFQTALINHGLSEQVTTFTHSEFGRTLIPNGTAGTDHGWASHALVMGGGVRGKTTLGTYPDLSPQSPYLLSRGRVIPTVSCDQLHASLMAWLGLTETGINTLFPALDTTGQNPIQPQTLPIFKMC
ncbi:twin-arginine translocation pathway signal protein [Vibrio azureus]|uniref:Tat pathway signal sequence domain protein n=1 Tax=Vibrio azureus NBRC 104587 TaxID=1219077 RepID=U3C5D9_9VIBR|nr:DUF1501 domain-containing protein [Vibrio azureus]AUI87646.1 twin-arginine translocation pathway signal protein [Vibrio azureus]GAD76634.1 hypothetical protein VAZ01S_049_00010 [Vibrio azureus NBRC 104587]